MAVPDPGLLCAADRSVLVVIDIQPRLTAAMPAKVLARLQRSASLMIRTAVQLDIPILATEQYPQGLGHLEPDIDRLLPPDTRKFTKTAFSCLGADGFIQALQALSREQVILIGMETHVCILQSTIELLNGGYRPVIITDAVCSRHRDNYETALNRMYQAGAVIANAESVIFEWLRDARHAQFKTIQGWLK